MPTELYISDSIDARQYDHIYRLDIMSDEEADMSLPNGGAAAVDDDDDEIDDDDTIVDDTRSSVSPSLYDDELEDSAFEAIEFDNETTAGTQVCHD
jgi:hypothetical protein